MSYSATHDDGHRDDNRGAGEHDGDDDLRSRLAPSVRHDGWSVERQLLFLEALAADGHVTRAATSVGRSASSAYRLRGRSENFARGWHAASAMAYHRLRDLALDRLDMGEVTEQLYHGKVVGTRTRYSDRLLIAMLNHLKPVAFDARVNGLGRPADPGVAYAAALAAYAKAIDAGTEPKVPLMNDDGRSRPVMTREEFIAAIRMRPRVPAPGDDAEAGLASGNGATPAAVAPEKKNEFYAWA